MCVCAYMSVLHAWYCVYMVCVYVCVYVYVRALTYLRESLKVKQSNTIKEEVRPLHLKFTLTQLDTLICHGSFVL